MGDDDNCTIVSLFLAETNDQYHTWGWTSDILCLPIQEMLKGQRTSNKVPFEQNSRIEPEGSENILYICVVHSPNGLYVILAGYFSSSEIRIALSG